MAVGGAGRGSYFFTNCFGKQVTFNTYSTFLKGGGGTHPLNLAGTGNWQLNSALQGVNSGNAVALVVVGPGTVNLVGAPASGVTYVGTYGNVTVNGGTLQLGAANAIGNGNRLVLT